MSTMTLIHSEHDAEILAGVASESLVLDVAGALDVDVLVSLDGGEYIEIETTVVPDKINGGYRAYGEDVSMWMASSSWQSIEALGLGREDCVQILTAIAGEACAQAAEQSAAGTVSGRIDRLVDAIIFIDDEAAAQDGEVAR